MRVRVSARCPVLALLGLIAVHVAHGEDSAVQQLHVLRQALRDTHARNDWTGNLDYALKQRELLNTSPNSRLEVARAEFFLGRTDQALEELTRYARMGQAVDLAQLAPEGAASLRTERFTRLRRELDANRKPISRATLAFVLEDANLLPEDIDYDAGGERFYISSVRENKIIAVDRHGAAHDFARAVDDWPVLALKVDAAHRRVWATQVAVRGFESVPRAAWGRSSLLCFELPGGRLVNRIEGPPDSALGDMVLTRGGAVIVSDGEGGGVYRVSVGGTALERLDQGDFISPQTPAMDAGERRVFVPDYLRGLGVLDLQTHRVQWLSMADRFALSGIDGLYRVRDQLLAVQNGAAPERVVAFHLGARHDSIGSESIIERATTSLGDPTHGVVVGDTFYYLANSGWDLLDNAGRVKAGAQPSPARVMMVKPAQL